MLWIQKQHDAICKSCCLSTKRLPWLLTSLAYTKKQSPLLAMTGITADFKICAYRKTAPSGVNTNYMWLAYTHFNDLPVLHLNN